MPDDDFGPLEVPDNWTELSEVEKELGRQDERWGEQNHPDIGGTADSRERSRRAYARELEDLRDLEALARARGLLGWDDILLEEVYEALSEEDEDNLRVELIQVAAVALQWAGAIRRRQKEAVADSAA